MVVIKHKGKFQKTDKFFKKMSKNDIRNVLNKYGQKGVIALMQATPKDTGKTATMWDYSITQDGQKYSIFWENKNVQAGVNIALILHTGHATGNGAYVRGAKYISPALEPIFDELADEAWKEVTSN